MTHGKWPPGAGRGAPTGPSRLAFMTSFITRLRRALRGSCGLAPGTPLVVAVSGGADSMALLHGLARLPSRERHPVTVAHLDHQLRGEEARADARFVQEWATTLGLPCVTESVAVRDAAERTREGVETTARHLRHQFLARVAIGCGARHVALAHHARDQAELFFLRLLRGSGTEGLAGMRHHGPSPAEPTMTLVRPLLDEPPETLREWLVAQELPWREDASNQDTTIPRNAVRHALLPVLETLAGASVVGRVVRAMTVLREESDFIESALREALGDMEHAGELPPALRRRAIVRQLIALGHEPTHELVEHLATRPHKARHVRGGHAVVAGPGSKVRRVAAPSRRPRAVPDASPIRVVFQDDVGEVRWPGARVAWSITRRRPDVRRARAEQGKAWLDADMVGRGMVWRRWKAGDRFHPLGAPGTAKVGDLFTNRRVPREERAGRWVAEATDGVICWVEGWPCGEAFKVTATTRRFLRIQFSRDKARNEPRTKPLPKNISPP